MLHNAAVDERNPPRQLCAASGGVRECPNCRGVFPAFGKCSLKIHHRDNSLRGKTILFEDSSVSTRSLSLITVQMYRRR